MRFFRLPLALVVFALCACVAPRPAHDGGPETVRLAPRSRVTLRLGPEGRDAVRQAQIVFISPVADPASGLVEFIAEFDNADGSVRPGVTGRLVLGADSAGRAPPVAPAGKAR